MKQESSKDEKSFKKLEIENKYSSSLKEMKGCQHLPENGFFKKFFNILFLLLLLWSTL
jgi:hypothetical protein